MKPNPFKPTAGGNPPQLIGRDIVLRDFSKGIDNGVGAPGRIMLVTGSRGSGKTVMLTALAEHARNRDWQVVSETGSDGLCERLVEAVSGAPVNPRRVVIRPELSVMGVSGSIGEIELGAKRLPSTLRAAFGARLDELERDGVGLLVTVDEAQAAERTDMVALATAIQHLVSENRDIAIVFAGLPELVSDLLNDKVITFMRRAKREILGNIAVEDIAQSFVETFASSGMHIAPDFAETAAMGTYGYAYMVQLVGYNIWDQVVSREHTSDAVVTREDIEAGIEEAIRELDETVCEPEIAALSNTAVEYLRALSMFDGPASTAQVAQTLGVTPQYANTYRRRLLDAQVLSEPRRGEIDFALPYLRDYLRRRALD